MVQISCESFFMKGTMDKDNMPKIYLWPNLMTAGNLCCGFFATLSIFSGMLMEHQEGTLGTIHHHYYQAIALILGACVFDALDGRMARLTGQDSPFGQEFDSLADVVSFGVAPAMLVHEIVLAEIPDKLGWIISFIYLLCGTIRLARFNCMASTPGTAPSKDFIGIPIPAAAGVISSLTLVLMWMDEKSRSIGPWKWALPPLMLLLAGMMVSTIRYPSFKGLNVSTKRTLPWFIFAAFLLVLTVVYWRFMPAVLFVSYLIYGPARHRISQRWRRELEEEDDEREREEAEEAAQAEAMKKSQPLRIIDASESKPNDDRSHSA
jgi:CDP-diacylglycerol---serine O-phosphatidyltransferase